jgi:hypothetical protein
MANAVATAMSTHDFKTCLTANIHVRTAQSAAGGSGLRRRECNQRRHSVNVYTRVLHSVAPIMCTHGSSIHVRPLGSLCAAAAWPIDCIPNDAIGCVTRCARPYIVTAPSPRAAYSAASAESGGTGALGTTPSAGAGTRSASDTPSTASLACTTGAPRRTLSYSSAPRGNKPRFPTRTRTQS